VVLRRTKAGETEVVLCRRETEDLWALPKGTPDNDETIAETALREVQEETGLEVAIVRKVASIKYSFLRESDGRPRFMGAKPGEIVKFDKEVHFFLMRPTGGDLSMHDHEFDEVRWIKVNGALDKLTHENESRIVEKAVALSKGPASGQAQHQD
jgi:8-oxo-dGTP pyrophosphatase MutT (NUDIX family)